MISLALRFDPLARAARPAARPSDRGSFEVDEVDAEAVVAEVLAFDDLPFEDAERPGLDVPALPWRGVAEVADLELDAVTSVAVRLPFALAGLGFFAAIACASSSSSSLNSSPSSS